MSHAFTNQTFAPATIFQWLPPRASTGSAQIDYIFYALIALATFFTVLIGVLILGFAVKYHAGSKADRSNPTGKALPIEITWIVAPLVLLLGVFVWAGIAFFNKSTPPENARSIYVVGKQWMWKIQHPTGRREINELHVPAGEPIKLIMTSQDVIHSFFVPAFRVKKDVVPGMYNQMWFEADQPGEYHLFCAEYCGSEHAMMRGKVVVMKPADFQRWLSAAPVVATPVEGTPGAPGAPMMVGGQGAFYKFGCNACHLPGAAVRAPRLDGLFNRQVNLRNGQSVTADEAYLRESILQPNAKIVAGYDMPSLMPTYQGQIDEMQLMELIEFIKSIREGWPEGSPPAQDSEGSAAP